jgi:bone morphogenetic protein 7
LCRFKLLDIYYVILFFSADHHVSSVRHERGKRLWFNVSEMPIAENVVGAELRIYQKEINATKRAKNLYTVTVYELVNTDSGYLTFLIYHFKTPSLN